MYSQIYDDYMRNFLGYPSFDGYRMNPMNMNSQSMTNEDIEQLYPEVYKVVYPMVCSTCDRIQFPTAPVTDDMITRMTNDIYDRIEADGRINVEVNIEVRENENRQNSSEKRQRRPRNRFLNDLIRILLLRELFNRRRFPGSGRPPFPIRPF